MELRKTVTEAQRQIGAIAVTPKFRQAAHAPGRSGCFVSGVIQLTLCQDGGHAHATEVLKDTFGDNGAEATNRRLRF